MLTSVPPLFSADVLKKCALIALHLTAEEEAEKMDVMLLISGMNGNWAVQRVQCGKMRAKLGQKTKACLQVTLEKAMCATKRCMSLGCTGSLLEGLGAGNGGIELSHGPGHAVPGARGLVG